MGLTQVSTDGVKNDAITKTKIPANQIEASELADNAVDTNAIADQAVALSKLPHGDSNNDGKFLRANNGADPSFETVSIPAGTTINNNADNRVITGSGTANTLNGESSVVIDANGKLGIGVGTPDTLLHVQGANNGASLSLLRLTNTGGSASTEARIEFELSTLFTGYIGQTHDSGDTGSLVFGNKTTSGAQPSEKMRITASGNVGIGKTPSRKLDIDTSHYVVTSSGQSTTGIHLDGSAGNAGEYGGGISFACGNSGSAAIAARQGTSDPDVVGLSFFTHNSSDGSANSVEKVRIHDGGSVSFNDGIILGNSLGYDTNHLLDDYEEGTWTPSFGNVNTPTYGTQYGRYCKIGSQVTLMGQITVDSGLDTSDGSTVNIQGFPFAGNSAADVCLFTFGKHTNLLSDSKLADFTNVRFGGTFVMLLEGNNADISYAECNSSGTLQFAISYIINT